MRIVTTAASASRENSLSAAPGKKNVQTVPELKQELQGMCRAVFTTLGWQQRESDYQEAFQIELKHRGIVVVKVRCA